MVIKRATGGCGEGGIWEDERGVAGNSSTRGAEKTMKFKKEVSAWKGEFERRQELRKAGRRPWGRGPRGEKTYQEYSRRLVVPTMAKGL